MAENEEMVERWTEDDVVNCIGGWAINYKRGVEPVDTRSKLEAIVRRVIRERWPAPSPPEGTET